MPMIEKTGRWWEVSSSMRNANTSPIACIPSHAISHTIPGAVCSVAILLGILIQCESRLHGSPRFAFTSLQGAASHQPGTILTRATVNLSVDATRHSADDPTAFKALCGRLTNASGVRPAGMPHIAAPDDGASVTPIRNDDTPDWYLWAQLNNQCSGVAKSTDLDSVQMYAVHSEAGGSICLANGSPDRTPFVLKLKLPKGVFRIERLSFKPSNRDSNAESPGSDKSGNSSTAATSISLKHIDVPACTSELRRLEGCDIAQATTIFRQGELIPGEVVIIRFTDVARAARVAFANLKTEIHNLASTTPGPAGRLSRIVAQGDGYMAGITEGSSSSRPKRLGCVHRLILLMSQAESLNRNYQSRQSVNAGPGAKTMGALERIEDSLAETSAVLSGLVPQIELGTFKRVGPVVADPSAGANAVETIATVSLVNSGAHSVESVKLGIDVSALPGGCTCTPDDPAFFGSLHPGQSVRAEFKLTLRDTAQTAPARFVADVSYFTSGAPAHLRPRPW